MNEPASNDAVLVSQEAGVGRIVLNRPDQINAINDAIRTGVPRALRQFDEDPAVRVILISANGPRGFCAGADIKESRGPENELAARQRLRRNPWIESFDAISKPIIVALHGYCFGGGLEVALACDIRIAAEGALFALPEVNLGLIPGGGGTQRLPRLIGLGRALDLMLSGDRINAEEALRLGLVTRLVPKEQLLEAALQLAQNIAAKPPTAVTFVKEAARAGSALDLKAGLSLERDLFALLQNTADRKEAAAAFREKRAPNFTGE